MHRKAVAFLFAAAPIAAAPLAAQTSVSVGQTVTGTLAEGDRRMENGAFYDTYTIQGRPGDRVIVRMRSESFDAYLRWGAVHGADWVEEHANDDSGEGTDARLLVTLSGGGRYELRATTFGEDEGGAYELSLSEPVALSTGRIRVGEPVQGEITESDYESGNGFEDHYILETRAGDVVTVFAESSEFDTYLSAGTWRDGALQETGSDDDGGVGTNSQLVVEAGPGGEVRVIVRAFSGAAGGPYTLRVQTGAAEPVEDEPMDIDGAEPMEDEAIVDARRVGTFVGPVQAGVDVRGTLGDGEPEGVEALMFYREYSYTAAAGENLTIDVRSGELDPYVSIGQGQGDAFRPLAEDDDGGEELDARLRFEVPRAGTYTIRVASAFENQTGPFTLRVTSGR